MPAALKDFLTAMLLVGYAGAWIAIVLWITQVLRVPPDFLIMVLLCGIFVGVFTVKIRRRPPASMIPEAGPLKGLQRRWFGLTSVTRTALVPLVLAVFGLNFVLYPHIYEGAALLQYDYMTCPFSAYRRGWPCYYFEDRIFENEWRWGAFAIDLILGIGMLFAGIVILEFCARPSKPEKQPADKA